jgi:hypothetical protein
MSQSQPSARLALLAPVRAHAARLGLSWVLAGLWLPGCRCSGPEPDARGDAESPLPGCRSACAAYSQARCPGRDAPTDQQECVQACAAGADLSALAGCGKSRDAYFECVARTPIDCASLVSGLGAALERGEGAPACAASLAALERCEAPCRNEGSTHLGEATGSGKLVKAELTRAGCTDCAKDIRGGAPPGSPCSAASVCQEHCCACAAGPGRYRARACVDGACAASDLTCALTPAAVQHSPCSR